MQTTLTDLVDLLWQADGAAVRMFRGTESLPPGWRELERYQVVRSVERPTYLLPLDCPPAARAQLLREYNDLRYFVRRSLRTALAAATAAEVLRPRSVNVIRIAAPPGWRGTTLRSIVGAALDVDAAELVMATSIRVAAGGVRPTVTVADQSGAPLVFLKVARSDLHHERLNREFDALEAVSKSPVPGLHAPAPLFRKEWDGRLILGVEPLPAGISRVRINDEKATWPTLEALQQHHPVTTGPIAGSEWALDLRTRIGRLPTPARDALVSELDGLEKRHGDHDHQHGQRHGDWSPWNLARTPDRGLVAWDWEFSQPNAPLGLDRLNWQFALETSHRDVGVEAAAAHLRAAVRREPGLPDDLTDVFLLDMAVRRAREARTEDAGSTEVARRLLALLRDY